jgi:hypothetical protein
MSEDSSRIEKERKRDVLNTVLNTNTTIRIVRSFSVPPEKVGVLKKFSEIVRREAGPRAFSEGVLSAMEEYNRKHEEGNPQLKIASYLPNTEKSPLHVLCSFCQGALKEGEVFCQKAGMWIQGIKCYSCKNNRLKRADKK